MADNEAVRYSDAELLLVAQVLRESGHKVDAEVVRSWFAREAPIPDDIFDQLKAVVAELPRLVLRARGQLARDPKWLAANLYEHLQESPAERRAKANPKNRKAKGWSATAVKLVLPPKCMEEMDLVWRVNGYKCRSDFYAVLIEMYWRGMREKFIEADQERRLGSKAPPTPAEHQRMLARRNIDEAVGRRWGLFWMKQEQRTARDRALGSDGEEDDVAEAPPPGWEPSAEQAEEAAKLRLRPTPHGALVGLTHNKKPYTGGRRGRKPKVKVEEG